jgi:hypothetical protein
VRRNEEPVRIGRGRPAWPRLAAGGRRRHHDVGPTPRWAWLLLLPSMAACSWWMAGRPDSTGDVLTFNHAMHTTDFGVECSECHGAIADATDLSTSFAAPESACLDCHDRDADCSSCHSDPSRRTALVYEAPDLAFSHQAHVARVSGDCSRCHATATATELPVPPPTMAICMSCHNHQEAYDSGRCLDCHTSMQRLPLRAVAEFDHGGDWLGRHGQVAHAGAEACLSCHVQSQCDDCHSTVAAAAPANLFPDELNRTLLHRGDFITTHPIEARADSTLCLRCHESSFCEDCHTANGLTARASNALQPHPAGWMDPASPNFHGPQARLQTASCAACHDQGAASNCVDCHAVGRVGGNPHPSGWSDRYDLSDVADNAMCQVCHTANGL